MDYIWMVVIGLALIAELMTGTFYLLMLAIAAGAAYLAQMAGASMLVQAICFLFTSVLACGAVFHFKRKIKTRPNPAILAIADANATAVRQIGEATQADGGMNAVNLKVAEQYVSAFQNMAKHSNTLVVPANMGDLSTLIASSMKIMDSQKK